MLTVVATVSDGADSVVERCRAILEQWSSYGFLHEFIWITGEPDHFEARLIRGGEAETTDDLSPLFTNYRGQVRLMVLSVITGDGHEVEGEMHLGDKVQDVLQDHFQSEEILTPIHLVVPEEIGVPLPELRTSPAPFIWSAEDRVGVDFASTLFDENFAAHTAHGVASLAEMWAFGDTKEKMEAVFAQRKGESTARLARCFIRFLIFPEIRHDLLAGLPVCGDEVLRPTDRYERVDLSASFSAMADHFIAQHQSCLGRSDTTEFEISEDGGLKEVSLLAAMKEQLQFITSFFTELPNWAIDRVGEMTYDWLKEKVSGGLPVYSWSTAQGEGEGGQQREINTDEIEPAIIDDGPFSEMWRQLEAAVFSLVDGSTFDWGASTPPHGANQLQIANSRLSVVGSVPGIPVVTSPELQAEADGATENSQPTESLAEPVTASDLSWLGTLAAHLGARTDSFTSDLNVLTEKLIAVQRELEEELAGEHLPPVPKNWRERIRNAMSSKKSEDKRPASIRRRMVRSMKRRSVVGAFFGVVVSSVLAIVLSPIGALISAVSFLIGTLVAVYRRAWEAHKEQLAAEEARKAKLARRTNLETKICYLKGDLLRVRRRVAELAIWAPIIREVVVNPYPVPLLDGTDIVPPEWSRPLAIGVGEAIIDPGVVKKLRKEFEAQFFVEGWIKTRFELLRSRFALENGVENPLSIEADSSSDRDSVLHHFSASILSPEESATQSRELLDRATSFLRSRDLKVIAPTARHLQDQVVRELEPVGSDEFLAETSKTGKFLQGEFLHPIHKEEDAIVGEANTSEFGSIQMSTITLPASDDKWSVPFIATGALHFTDELSISDRLRSDEY